MKKRIGTKITLLIGILSAVFILFCIANVAALSEIDTRSTEITDTFLKLEKTQGTLSVQVQELWLYKEPEDIQAAGLEFLEDKMKSIQEQMEIMAGLCQESGDKSLIDSYGIYQEQMEEFLNLGMQIANAVLAGDMESLAPMVEERAQLIASLEESKIAYTEDLENRIQYVSDKIDIKISGTFVFDVIAIVIFLVFSAATMLIVIRTVANPAKNASGHLNQIVEKIQKNEGDLTERIDIQTEDEVGQLVQGVNGFIEQLQMVMQKLKDHSEQMFTRLIISTIGCTPPMKM